MGSKANKSNRTYFELLPLDLKLMLLTYIPYDVSKICEKQSAFTNACLNEDY